MPAELRWSVAIGAHMLMSAAAAWIIWTSGLPVWARCAGLLLAAAALLPWLRELARQRRTRLSWLALLLVLIIGAGVVEVFATQAAWPATALLGAAMLEFAVLITLTRARRPRAANE